MYLMQFQCFTHYYQVDQHISLCEQYSSSDEVVAGVVANTNIGECLCIDCMCVWSIVYLVGCNSS